MIVKSHLVETKLIICQMVKAWMDSPIGVFADRNQVGDQAYGNGNNPVADQA
ncbi:MAG: hypothetical protein WA667_24065 [Candidatus Nitrosopolaris sp.]